jgi:hypothetical protein
MTQNLALSGWGVREMSPAEAVGTEGGFVPLLIVGAAILLGSCGNTIIYNGNGSSNTNTANSTSSIDSSGNGSLSGNRFP